MGGFVRFSINPVDIIAWNRIARIARNLAIGILAIIFPAMISAVKLPLEQRRLRLYSWWDCRRTVRKWPLYSPGIETVQTPIIKPA